MTDVEGLGPVTVCLKVAIIITMSSIPSWVGVSAVNGLKVKQLTHSFAPIVVSQEPKEKLANQRATGGRHFDAKVLIGGQLLT